MILRTELRRSSAPVLGVGFLVLSLGLLYGLSGPWGKRPAAWDEEWMGLAQWTRYLTLFLAPLVLAVGAWQGLREKRSGVPELFATTPRPAWRRVLPTAGALAVALTAAYVVLLTVGGVRVAGTASYFHLKWVPVAGVMVVALVALALLGAGIGRLVPSLVTPPVLAVAALAGQMALLATSWQLLLTPAFDSPSIGVFTSVAVPVTLAQLLWFAGIGVTGFCLLVAVGTKARLAALLPVALAAAVAVPVLSTVDAVVADPDARALVCDDRGPRVCVTAAHADYLPTVAGTARDVLARLEKLPSPPTSAVEVPWETGARAPAGAMPMYFPSGLPTDADKLRSRLLAGGDSRECWDAWEASTRIETARILVASWFTGELAPVPGTEYLWKVKRKDVQRLWQALLALPAEKQAARVAGMRESIQYCRDDLDLP
ncbi:hypothetical protein [Actinophytocola sp.]|uniref:hypothetical protein n=1 Tax=Actinophytocola sp. TaxID=1872138 RepID=UPI00389A26E0